ncbi:hypothetical protein CGLO_10073 [Colletotrichum gloeosporioides Cg-14]|jgi:hypothetical protein
MSAP